MWSALSLAGAARFPGAAGRIPNFVGAEAAAHMLSTLPEWKTARVVKSNPDAPQLPVRTLALREGKELYMAVPRLRAERCFLHLDPVALAGRASKAASISGAATYGRPVLPREMPRVDLIVAGSVAVGRGGARVGKGGGFSDLEWGLLVELGLVGEWTTVVTTVHPLQILRARIPMLPHDVPLDAIVTPERVIRCRPRRRRPPGVLWDALPPEKLEDVPLLTALARRGSARTSPHRRR